ncbi:MAG: protein kinase [Bacteroidetes bacterium]|nr:protein kinase [Bacteroidota bacterium]
MLNAKFIEESNQVQDIKSNKPKFYKVGEYIDTYKITKHFNSHDTFQVYEALDQHKQKVIVKLYQLKDGYTEEEKAYAHAVLYRELIILKLLCKHNSVSQLIEYDETKNYGVIEFIQGTSLRKFALSKSIQYSILEMMQIWYQILESISYLQHNQYIHGDLHFSNILIEKDLRVRLIDFGLALHTSEIDLPNIRKGGIHAFIPPERLNDSYFNVVQSNATMGSDIYQVGILGYILLYRKVPFKAKNLESNY